MLHFDANVTRTHILGAIIRVGRPKGNEEPEVHTGTKASPASVLWAGTNQTATEEC